MRQNKLLLTDSYKITHWPMYPKGTQEIYSYMAGRSALANPTYGNGLVVFGVQAMLKEFFGGPFVTQEDIDEAEAYCAEHFGWPNPFNRAGWEHIVKYHEGRLPLHIQSLDEGTYAPLDCPILTVVNTDEACGWVTNYVESLLMHLWSPISVATYSREFYKSIREGLVKSAPSLDSLPFKLHDFGYRGVSSNETAWAAAAAHLVHFSGTDTIGALPWIREYYGGYDIGKSIRATEHSVMCSWGEANEERAILAALQGAPHNPVSLVGDSYDIDKFVSTVVNSHAIRAELSRRDGSKPFIIRPDSGDPITTPLRVIETLLTGFKSECKTHNGYRILPDYLRVIQGDGINLTTTQAIINNLLRNNISTECIAFGCGGSLLQKHNRDSLGFAIKCSSTLRDGQYIDVIKRAPSKNSLTGRFSVERDSDGKIAVKTLPRNMYGKVYITEGHDANPAELLRTRYCWGELHNLTTFDEIKERAKASL